MSVKLGLKSLLTLLYGLGLITSLSLSYYSYYIQSAGLNSAKNILTRVNNAELWQGLYALHRNKINRATLGLLRKEKSWHQDVLKLNYQMIELINSRDLDSPDLLNSLQKQMSMLDDPLKLEEPKDLITSLKNEERIIKGIIKNNKDLVKVENQSFLGDIKLWLELLSRYSYGMSFLFSLFLIALHFNKLTQKKLLKEQKKREFMLDALDNAVVLLNKDKLIISHNQKAKMMWKGLGDIQGQKVNELFPLVSEINENEELVDTSFEDSPIVGLANGDYILGLRLKSFGLEWYSLTIQTYKDELYLLSLTNVTGLIQANQTIKKQQKHLIHQSKLTALGQMSGGMAHEINNPLAIISSEAEELLEIAEDEGLVAKADALSISSNIQKTADRIAKIVKGLRVFARQDKGEDYSSFPLNILIEDVLAMSSEKFRANGVEFTVTLPENNRDILLLGNEVQIIQVLVNLLNNAFDATKEQKERRIWFTWKQEDDFQLISIKDNGPGITENNQEKVFDPFFTTKKVGEGTGLGLSLSHSIMIEHEGDLYLNKEVSNGCEFIIKVKCFRELEEKWAG